MKRAFFVVHASLLSLLLASACGSDETRSSGGSSDAGPTEPEGTLEPEANPSLKLRLSSLVYADGDAIDVTLDTGGREPSSENLTVVVVSAETKDAEPVELERRSDGTYRAKAKLPIDVTAAAAPNDGVLAAAPGELFTATYYVDRESDAFSDVTEQLVSDFGVLEDPEAEEPTTLDELALTDDEEREDSECGTLLTEEGMPVQVATGEVILYARSEQELDDFLDETSGEVLDEQPVELGDEPLTAYLIGLDSSQVNPRHLPALRALTGESGDLYVSRPEASQILTLVHYYQLEGYLLSVNPRFELHAAPALSPDEEGAVTHSMRMVAAATVEDGICVPGDDSRPCVENAPATWAFNELWDRTDRRVNVAVLDMGFAPNDDFRAPEDGELHQCDMTVRPPRCANRAAEGPPTVGNSFFGDRSWHGTGVVQTIGGVVNNGFGAAGVAGQVAVPMLYKYDFRSYAFDMGSGIRRAVDDGASVINISAGYPCNIVANVGPDFNICSIEGRLGICTVVTAAVHAAAAVTCATLGWIPIAGAIACGAATSGAIAATAACVSTLALGDLRGPMESSVAYAASRGVPVVTTAGNRLPRDAYPEGIRDYIGTGEARTERWQMIPAMIPQCIVAGAVGEDLDNAHFYGDRVDLWAPIPTAYLAPEDPSDPDSDPVPDEIGGTSAAAPYIAGVIANLQAVNPELDPANPGLSARERAGLVARIKELLTSSATSFDNDELVELGFSDQPEERRKLVDPLAALRAAAAETLPDLDGYDVSLNYSERLAPDDDEASARAVEFDEPMTGTLLTLPIEGMSVSPDEDHFAFEMPDGAQPFVSEITLNYPAEYGGVSLSGGGLRLIANGGGATEAERTYAVLGDPGEEVGFLARAASGADNVYKVTVSEPEPAVPVVDITSLSEGGTVCADTPVLLQASASFPLFPGTSVPSSSLTWREGTTVLGTGNGIDEVFTAGSHTVNVRAYGRADASDSVTITAEACASDPPVISITQPSSNATYYHEGFDDELGLSYVEVTLTGQAIDPEDGALSGTSLVWKTDRTDFQDEILGTGTSITVRLYGDDCFGVVHNIRLEATDSSDTAGVPVTRQITIAGELC